MAKKSNIYEDPMEYQSETWRSIATHRNIKALAGMARNAEIQSQSKHNSSNYDYKELKSESNKQKVSSHKRNKRSTKVIQEK